MTALNAGVADTPAMLPDRADEGGAVVEAASGYAIADEVVVFGEPGSPRAESIGALRTHLMAQHLPAGRRSLALCSPSAGVGCTALAVNLAVALAEAGVKTLLIDADMRNPAVQDFIVPARGVVGLQQCLADEAVEFGDAIQFEVLPNLAVMYAGGHAERPQELLATPRFAQLVDLCLRDFDVTIADTPPSGTSADARRIAGVIGYAVLVAGRDKTFVSDMKVLAEELMGDHSTVIGSVLNQL